MAHKSICSGVAYTNTGIWGVKLKMGGICMSKREEQYLDRLYSKFSDLIDRFMKSDTVIWPEKEPVLVNFKDMIDDRIRELHEEDGMP